MLWQNSSTSGRNLKIICYYKYISGFNVFVHKLLFYSQHNLLRVFSSVLTWQGAFEASLKTGHCKHKGYTYLHLGQHSLRNPNVVMSFTSRLLLKCFFKLCLEPIHQVTSSQQELVACAFVFHPLHAFGGDVTLHHLDLWKHSHDHVYLNF